MSYCVRIRTAMNGIARGCGTFFGVLEATFRAYSGQFWGGRTEIRAFSLYAALAPQNGRPFSRLARDLRYLIGHLKFVGSGHPDTLDSRHRKDHEQTIAYFCRERIGTARAFCKLHTLGKGVLLLQFIG